MKSWGKYLDEYPKKQIAAADNIVSEKQVSPPNFNLNAKGPIQAKKGNLFDVNKTPSPAGPIPIPYPNIKGNKKGSGNGIMNKIGSVVSGAMNSVSDFVGEKSNDAQVLANSFSGSSAKYLEAVKFGNLMFKISAHFSDLKIMAVSAFGGPGCLKGPDLENFISNAPSVAGMNGKEKSMRDAVAKGVSKNFEKWRSMVVVPGLPWYPAFAAFPGPHAPPMPNIPFPLITCPSARTSAIISAQEIKKSIYNELPASMQDAETEAFVNALAIQISMHFLIWLTTQQIMNVLGTGPIPSFAPPNVPVGPVINGFTIPTPGHLIT